MIKKKIQDEINEQIREEFQSAWLYLQFSAWFESRNLDGFANWMKAQWQEEQDHGMKLYKHLVRRGGDVQLKDLDAPKITAESVRDVFEQVLEHERHITKRIHKLYDIADSEDDYPLQVLLHWFIDEQVEEEEMATSILERLKLIGEEGTSLYVLDRELAERDVG